MSLPHPNRFKTNTEASHQQRPHHLLAAWMRAPLKIGAVVPSSRRLSRAMADEVDLSCPGAVIELGAGTGVVTHALLAAGIPNDRLIVIERDPRLYAPLVSHFPHVDIVCGDALQLRQLIAGRGISQVSALVSSLPLLGMPKDIRLAVEQQMLGLLVESGGRLIQFTYGPGSPISVAQLHKFNVSGRRIKFVMANIPPAHVWVYQPKTS